MIKTEERGENSPRNGFDYLKASLSGAINSSEIRAKIESLIQEVSSLKDIEKLLFCLLLPTDGNQSICNSSFGFSSDDHDLSSGFDINTLGVGIFSPSGPSAIHLSNQVEQSQAYTWIMSHLEEDPSTCLRKDEVYEDYRTYCEKHHMKTLNTADFGKVMKRAFPNVKPRRLGQRGQSRYCYGGMRKKTEVQPPFLPDLAIEALGTNVPGSGSRFIDSPASSSGGSADLVNQRHPSSPSPLIRLLKSGGSEYESVSWADDASIRTVLGIRGSIVADVAHILLEYAQQVFGVQFKSLFQLAQHLVSNRYVNSRSRHAFSLIAHAANSTSNSPPPSTALAEAIQKGATKSAFEKLRNGRQSSGSADPVITTKDTSRTPTSSNTSLHQLAAHPSPNDVRSPSTTRPTIGQTVPPLPIADLNATSRLPQCTTPQPSSYRSYHSSISPHVGSTAQVSLASTTLATTSQSFSSFYLGQPFQSSPINNSTTSPYPHLTHPTTAVALAAAAAVAAHQKQQQQQQQQQQSSFSHFSPNPAASGYGPPSVGSNLNQSSPNPEIRFSTSNLGVTTPPAAHRDKNTSLLGPSTPSQHDSAFTNLSAYLSPASQNSNYSAHKQSPYPQSQAPAPLPPGIGARSPYTPIGHPVVTPEPDLSGNKRKVLPNPVEAPGAYEPSPRFHLGGQSPNKRARYLSTASGSSTNSLSTDCQPQSSGSGADSYSDQVTPGLQHPRPVGIPSPSSTHSNVSHNTSANTTVGFPVTRPHSMVPSVPDHSGITNTSYYTGRYEGLEMRSPIPSNHGSYHPQLPSAATNWGQQSTDYLANQGCHMYGSVHNNSNTVVFRPPITPFTLELDSDDDVENLPRLGTSPGPQIPPSSPTEFLPFYSEAASKSAQAKQKQYATTPHVHNTPESDDHSGGSVNNSPCLSIPSRDRVTQQLETPPPTNLVPHSVDTGHGNISSPTSSCDSNDRTLTMFETLGEVNTPPVPGGLANMPSPTAEAKSDSMLRPRSDRQNELSTPGPSESGRSPSVNSSCPKNADVSIPAF